MRPTALETLRGVRDLLAREILPEATAPHLRAQVGLAIGMLDAAAAEIDDATAAYIEERQRTIALAREAEPVVRRLAGGDALASALGSLAQASPSPSDLRLAAMEAESARLAGLLRDLDRFCDDHEAAEDQVSALARRVDEELRAVTARRLRWTGGGPPG